MPEDSILYVYHASLEAKEFDFEIQVPSSSSSPSLLQAVHEKLQESINEASSTILAQVQPTPCVTCGSPAVKLVHHLMYFDDVIPRRVEDVPDPLCGRGVCETSSTKKWNEMMQTMNPGSVAVQGCKGCGAVVVGKMMQCSRCKNARYCGAACQKAHWPKHKLECVAVS